jgi:hypothetical protein
VYGNYLSAAVAGAEGAKKGRKTAADVAKAAVQAALAASAREDVAAAAEAVEASAAEAVEATAAEAVETVAAEAVEAVDEAVAVQAVAAVDEAVAVQAVDEAAVEAVAAVDEAAVEAVAAVDEAAVAVEAVVSPRKRRLASAGVAAATAATAQLLGQEEPAPHPGNKRQKTWTVQGLLGRRVVTVDGQDVVQYLVKWKGFKIEESTWEPQGNLMGAQVKAWQQELDAKAETAGHDGEAS